MVTGDISKAFPSACVSVCSTCIDTANVRFSYLPGDVLILGLFSVRQYGDSAFTCGHIRRGTNDIITVSSFMRSVARERADSSTKFGAIAIDDCYSGLNASDYLTDLFSKNRFIRDPQTNEIINFDNIVAIVGALSSGVTLYVADMATTLGIPMISYSASSPDLDNRVRYPYFLRTVPSDTLQVQGMIETLEYLKVTHVGLVYIDDAYGRAGKDALIKEAVSRNICIEDPIGMVQVMSDEEVRDVIRKLFEQEVRVVLFFSIDSIARKVLETIAQDESNRQLTFISSDGWGTNQNLVEGELGLKSHGSLIFTISTRSSFDSEYKNYLSSLNVTQSSDNVWIPYFFEDVKHCDLKTSFEKYHDKICARSEIEAPLDSELVESLNSDQRGIHTKVAVHAVAEGYRQFCRKQSTCSPALSRSSTQSLVNDLKNVQIDNTKIFDENGNGNIGYAIFNIQFTSDGDSYTNEYVEVRYTQMLLSQPSIILVK